jgi:uncharacterized protein YqgC (DUF456 family)
MLFQVLVTILVVLLMALGLLGSILPFLPGSPLIFAGAFIYAWYTGFSVITWKILAVLAGLTLISQVLDHLASIYGARRFGASRWGMLGAFLGGVVGIFIGGFAGIFLGPFLGAVLFEWIHGARIQVSLRIGWGTALGLLGGVLGKLLIALWMIGIFLVKVL